MQSILLLDRYFLSVNVLRAWLEEEAKAGRKLLSIVTKAKLNAVAYKLPRKKTGRGRPQTVKGDRVKLIDLFKTYQDSFISTQLYLYGELCNVRYLCIDLLWGENFYHLLRFVLVMYNDGPDILVSTDLSLTAEQIIRLYGYRFKIETLFRSFSQIIAGFCYHFWSLAVPKLDRFKPAKKPEENLAKVTDKKQREKIISTFKAIEGSVLFCCIGMGILQMLALQTTVFSDARIRWLRTYTNATPSEGTIADLLRKSYDRYFHRLSDLSVFSIIRDKQLPSDDTNRLIA